ncbi:MAG: hypothetical protein J6K17_00170 [Oscillospiraceae bacterium]|nr:hypothetical protein [Oscillospiraceae bacterium]
MEYIKKIKKMLCKELEEIAESGKLKTPADISMIKDLTGAVKNIGVIEMQEEESSYSEARGGRGRGGRSSYEGGMSYDDEMMYSGRRGRGTNAKRDSMGRYSSEGESYDDYSEEMSYRGGQGGRGYSRNDAKDHMMSKLGGMMEDADPNEREILKDCMRKLERV